MNKTGLMNEHLGEITALKSLLSDTDYHVLKSVEGLLTCTTLAQLLDRLGGLAEDIRQTIARREAWRARINALEADMAQAPSGTDGENDTDEDREAKSNDETQP